MSPFVRKRRLKCECSGHVQGKSKTQKGTNKLETA